MICKLEIYFIFNKTDLIAKSLDENLSVLSTWMY